MRQRQGRTLREVSAAARVSLGYLSEVERGQKEASSELLSAICSALSVPLSLILREVSDRIAVAEGVQIPDTVPPELELQDLAGVRLARFQVYLFPLIIQDDEKFNRWSHR